MKQEKAEEIYITSPEKTNPEEYLKFVFPKLPPSESILRGIFARGSCVCELEALGLQEKSEESQTLNQDTIRRHIQRFSKPSNQANQRSVELEEELDHLFAHTTRNATQRQNILTPNQSNLKEVTLEDDTKLFALGLIENSTRSSKNSLMKPLLYKQNMKEGKAPLGKDGKIMELHNLQQKEEGILLELTYTKHKENSRALHGYKKSEVDRKKFAKFKKGYWKARAEDLEKKS